MVGSAGAAVAAPGSGWSALASTAAALTIVTLGQMKACWI